MKKDKSHIKKSILFAFLASLTLGLAPFHPEPHIVGKIRWILGGAKGMQAMDYLDTLLHGIPWIVLIYFAIQYICLNVNE